VDKDYKSELYDTKREAYAALAKLRADKSTVWSKLSVREVDAKGRLAWLPAKVSEVRAANGGKDLRDPNGQLKKGWKAGEISEVSKWEYDRNRRSDDALYWSGKEIEGKWG